MREAAEFAAPAGPARLFVLRPAQICQKVQQNRGEPATGPSLASGSRAKFFADRHSEDCVRASATSRTISPASISRVAGQGGRQQGGRGFAFRPAGGHGRAQGRAKPAKKDAKDSRRQAGRRQVGRQADDASGASGTTIRPPPRPRLSPSRIGQAGKAGQEQGRRRHRPTTETSRRQADRCRRTADVRSAGVAARPGRAGAGIRRRPTRTERRKIAAIDGAAPIAKARSA